MEVSWASMRMQGSGCPSASPPALQRVGNLEARSGTWLNALAASPHHVLRGRLSKAFTGTPYCKMLGEQMRQLDEGSDLQWPHHQRCYWRLERPLTP